MSKVLVTGSDGQLGRELQSLAGDHFVFVNRDQLNILDFSAVRNKIIDGGFNYVVNCAAYTAVDKAEEEVEACYEVNVNAVKNIADVCQENNCTMIHISSDYIYHPSHDIPMDETEACLPQGTYAKSKLAGENYIKEVLSNYYILRTSWVYSSFGNNFVKTMLGLGKTRSQLNVVGDQIGSPTYAGDLANIILTIIKKGGKAGIYNYSNLGYISWAEFAEEIFRLANLNVEVNTISTLEYPTLAPRPLNSRLIKSRIADEFGIELYMWKNSLQRCLSIMSTSGI